MPSRCAWATVAPAWDALVAAAQAAGEQLLASQAMALQEARTALDADVAAFAESRARQEQERELLQQRLSDANAALAQAHAHSRVGAVDAPARTAGVL